MNKWINPFFWEHPTPLNLILLTGIIVSFFWVAIWVLWFAINILPWPFK